MNKSLAFVVLAALAASCSSLYYSTMETFGYGKRDLLIERVQKAREAQGVGKQQIENMLAAFQRLTGAQAGDFEASYKEFKSVQDGGAGAAKEVRDRIAGVETVALDMFREWGEEIVQIQDTDLRQRSEKLRTDTETRCRQVVATMKGAEAAMQPVLTSFHDQVLFLKHDLNADAIGSLQKEAPKLQGDVAGVSAQLQKSIDEADQFIASIPKEQK